MIIFRRIATIIFILNMTHLLFAGDNPLWVIDIKPPGKSGNQFSYLHELNKSGSGVKVYFSHENDILITFSRYEVPDNRKIKNAKNSKPTVFVALLINGETGNLIKRVEWSVDKSIASSDVYIHAFPEGGYLLRIGGNLQALDSSLSVIHRRTLAPLPPEQAYNIIMPRLGYYFVVDQNINGRDRIYEIMDWRTFETVEKMNASDFRIKDIWNDRLLGIDLLRAGKYRWLLEKKMGDSSWTNFQIDSPRLQDAKFIYNGAIVVTCSMDDSGLFGPSFWFIMEDGKRSDPVYYGKNDKERMGEIVPTAKSPVIAVYAYKLSDMRMFLDIGLAGTFWRDYWDVTTRQRLLRIKVEKDEVDCELSSDGRKLVVLKKKKLEMYDLPTTPAKEE